MNIAAVIPTYKVAEQIMSVINRIGPMVDRIYVVDDCCPQGSGRLVAEQCRDSRVVVLFHEKNEGVGGAMITGYRRALSDGADIVVKLDGDGQMDPKLIRQFISPIIRGVADYTKGNRFYAVENLDGMPWVRIFGNTILSFVNKLSSGYWNIMDPTNGYTAIHSSVLSSISLHKLEKRYFFESDMLFRLNIVRAVVQDIPMRARYGDEQSNLSTLKVIRDFPSKYLFRFLKRLFYNYILRDVNACSIEMAAGFPMFIFGAVFGIYNWYSSATHNIVTPTGTIMLAVLPVIVGVQLLLAALSYDVSNIPRIPLQDTFALHRDPPALRISPQKVAND